MMNDLPRQQLQQIISRYGRSVAEDPQRCEALLRDACGQYRKEINVLVSAIKESIPVDLNNSQHRVPSDLLLAQFTKRLEDRLAIDPTAARWGVESWAIALGLISEASSVVEPAINLPSTSPPAEPFNPSASPNHPPTQPVNHPPLPNPPPAQSVVIDPTLSSNSKIRLFTQNQVILATFFGGLLAGAILMALNYKNTGKIAKSKHCLIIGLIPNVITDLLMFIYNPYIAGQFLGFILFPSIYIVHKWYEKSQNTLFRSHLSVGGKKASWWGVIFTVICSIISIAPLLNLPMLIVAIIAGDKF